MASPRHHYGPPPSSFALEVTEAPPSHLRHQGTALLTPSIRREPLFEFFSLCLLSQKMTHSTISSVCLLNAETLYRQATEVERLPFHRYHEFIEGRVQRIVRDHLYRRHKKRQEERERRRWLEGGGRGSTDGAGARRRQNSARDQMAGGKDRKKKKRKVGDGKGKRRGGRSEVPVAGEA